MKLRMEDMAGMEWRGSIKQLRALKCRYPVLLKINKGLLNVVPSSLSASSPSSLSSSSPSYEKEYWRQRKMMETGNLLLVLGVERVEMVKLISEDDNYVSIPIDFPFTFSFAQASLDTYTFKDLKDSNWFEGNHTVKKIYPNKLLTRPKYTWLPEVVVVGDREECMNVYEGSSTPYTGRPFSKPLYFHTTFYEEYLMCATVDLDTGSTCKEFFYIPSYYPLLLEHVPHDGGDLSTCLDSLPVQCTNPFLMEIAITSCELYEPIEKTSDERRKSGDHGNDAGNSCQESSGGSVINKKVEKHKNNYEISSTPLVSQKPPQNRLPKKTSFSFSSSQPSSSQPSSSQPLSSPAQPQSSASPPQPQSSSSPLQLQSSSSPPISPSPHPRTTSKKRSSVARREAFNESKGDRRRSEVRRSVEGHTVGSKAEKIENVSRKSQHESDSPANTTNDLCNLQLQRTSQSASNISSYTSFASSKPHITNTKESRKLSVDHTTTHSAAEKPPRTPSETSVDRLCASDSWEVLEQVPAATLSRSPNSHARTTTAQVSSNRPLPPIPLPQHLKPSQKLMRRMNIRGDLENDNEVINSESQSSKPDTHQVKYENFISIKKDLLHKQKENNKKNNIKHNHVTLKARVSTSSIYKLHKSKADPNNNNNKNNNNNNNNNTTNKRNGFKSGVSAVNLQPMPDTLPKQSSSRSHSIASSFNNLPKKLRFWRISAKNDFVKGRVRGRDSSQSPSTHSDSLIQPFFDHNVESHNTVITSNITHSDKSNSNDGTESDKMDDENASAGDEGWQMRMMRARIKSKKSDRSNEPKAACYSEALDNEVVVLNDERNDKVNNEIKKSIITRPTLLSKSNEDTIWNEDYDIIGGCHANGRGVIHRKISKSMDELNSAGATDEGVSYDDSYYESIKDNLLHSPHHHPPSPHQPLPSPHHRLPSSFVHPLSPPQHPPLFVKPPAPQVRIKKIERELSSNSQQVMKQESNQFAGDETDSNDKEENDKKEDGVKENGNERVDEIEKMNGVEDIDAGAFMEDSYGWGSSDNSSYNQNGKKDASEVYLEMHSSSYLKPCNDAPSSDDSKADVLSTDSNNKSNNKNNNLFRQPEDIITKNYDTYNTNNDSRYTNINDNNELTNNRQTYLTPQKEGGWNNVWEIPKSMENFNVMEVMRSLELLGMGAYGDKFKKEQVDGSLLASLDVDILVEDFAFKKFDAIKLIKFCKEGWRPKVDS